jgi:hypothetical protein
MPQFFIHGSLSFCPIIDPAWRVRAVRHLKRGFMSVFHWIEKIPIRIENRIYNVYIYLYTVRTLNALLKIVAEVILIISIANGQIFLSQPNSPPLRSFDCSKMQITTPPFPTPIPHPPFPTPLISYPPTAPSPISAPSPRKNREKQIFYPGLCHEY